MPNNIFINSDPVLGTREFDTQSITMIENELSERMNRIQQLKAQAQRQQTMQSRTPVWDEIDAIMKGMTDKEFELVSNDAEWKESNDNLLALIQATQLQILKPIIEGTQEGKDLLDHHLTITKRIKKSASKAVDEELNDFKEYREKYSDMPYAEYVKMKRNPQPKKR